MAPRKKKVVSLDAPAPSVVDALAEQRAALYADHPDVVAQAKAYAAQRLAEAQATEAEAKARAVVAMSDKLRADAAAAKAAAVLDARSTLLAQHTGLCALAQRLLMEPNATTTEIQRAQSLVDLARELRLATRSE